MARSIDPKCRKCRRAMEKLFLKGDRCISPKCSFVKRSYAPGVNGKKPKRGLSEYGTQLMVKQKIKRIYGVLEKQFKKHFEEIKNKPGVTGDLLLERLETRLDNVVFRIGWGTSRAQARQLVNHGLITVNHKRVNIPSYEVKIKDVIAVADNKKEKKYFQNIDQVLKNKKDRSEWIAFDESKKEATILRKPTRDEVGINLDAQIVVEYYSR
jgi:small subunit ribosomal protein S4